MTLWSDQGSVNDISDLVKQLEADSSKDVRIAHLSVRSLRNKIDELRCLQLLCRFEILAITETHLDKSVTNSLIDVPNKNEKRCGRCVLYYANHVQAVHRKDLITNGLEAAWLLVKFPDSSVLFAVIYRPPDSNQFFNLIGLKHQILFYWEI